MKLLLTNKTVLNNFLKEFALLIKRNCIVASPLHKKPFSNKLFDVFVLLLYRLVAEVFEKKCYKTAQF